MCGYLTGLCRFDAAHHIGVFLIITDHDFRILLCHQSGFQNAVHLLHVFLRQRFGNGVQHPVQTPEMIRRFKNIVDEHSTVHALGFENITGLFMSQPAALYMIGIIGKIHLHFMIDPTVDSMILLEKKRFF